MKSALKFLGILVVLVVAYKAADVYALIRWSFYVGDCAEQMQLCRLAKERAPNAQVIEAVDKLYACVAERQPFHESLILRLPKQHDHVSEPLDYRYGEAFCRSQ